MGNVARRADTCPTLTRTLTDFLLTLLDLAVTDREGVWPGGVRAVMAENLLLKQQLIVLRRARRRAPNLTQSDRLLCGFWSLFLSPERIRKVRHRLPPSTLLTFHQALVRRKYRRLFSSTSRRGSPARQGRTRHSSKPSSNSSRAILGSAVHGFARIIAQTFGVEIDKNVVYRVLSNTIALLRAEPGLVVVVHRPHQRRLWSVDLFRCESIVLRSYWVLVVMDQFTRRLVGIGVHCGAVTGADVCRMFNAAIHGQGAPRHLSTDHDPLFEAHRWMATSDYGDRRNQDRAATCPCPTHSWSA